MVRNKEISNFRILQSQVDFESVFRGQEIPDLILKVSLRTFNHPKVRLNYP